MRTSDKSYQGAIKLNKIYMEIAGFRNEGGIRRRTQWRDLRFFSALIGSGLRFFQCHDARPEPTPVAEEIENHAILPAVRPCSMY